LKAGVEENVLAHFLRDAAAYHSCFMSYSSKDTVFTSRVRADIEQQRIRTWFAPEDMKIGDRTRDRIYEFIEKQDRVLLVLSEASVKSPLGAVGG
jgi:hypothetical protein